MNFQAMLAGWKFGTARSFTETNRLLLSHKTARPSLYKVGWTPKETKISNCCFSNPNVHFNQEKNSKWNHGWTATNVNIKYLPVIEII